MKCKCEQTQLVNQSLNVFNDHILLVYTCKCGRRIHKRFELKDTLIFE